MTKRTASDPADQPMAVSLTDAARQLGLGIGTVRALIADGRLPIVRVGRRVLIPVAGLTALLDERLTISPSSTGSRPELGAASDAAPTSSPISTAPEPELDRDGSD